MRCAPKVHTLFYFFIIIFFLVQYGLEFYATKANRSMKASYVKRSLQQIKALLKGYARLILLFEIHWVDFFLNTKVGYRIYRALTCLGIALLKEKNLLLLKIVVCFVTAYTFSTMCFFCLLLKMYVYHLSSYKQLSRSRLHHQGGP